MSPPHPAEGLVARYLDSEESPDRRPGTLSELAYLDQETPSASGSCSHPRARQSRRPPSAGHSKCQLALKACATASLAKPPAPARERECGPSFNCHPALVDTAFCAMTGGYSSACCRDWLAYALVYVAAAHQTCYCHLRTDAMSHFRAARTLLGA
ncbi:hypothetical protein BV20DRAFT_35154 [Pilatotrama ljubarskyi]|nr:hypothetical protein BV20DRAFT_35154 [Pilatotrama ljubarskyi]